LPSPTSAYEEAQALSAPEAYEHRLVPSLFGGWAASLVRLVDLRPGERVLDVACGTGIVARLAAPRVGATGSVTGLDIDPEMLRVARETASAVVPTIRWQEGDALGLPFPDGSFDVVLCQQGVQFFADGTVALGEMRRVLAPGGRVAVGAWRGVQNGGFLAALATTLERYVDREAIEEMSAPCPFADPGVLRRLITQARLRNPHLTVLTENLRADSTAEFVEQVVLASSLGPWLSRLDPKARGRLVAELDVALLPYSDDGRFSIPVAANVALAQR
jgi:ubiquinone/menaquinone biosynthesis C-methylase UbiE